MEESGTGTFGRVLLCEDVKTKGRVVAMKVVRAVDKYVESAEVEAKILRKLNAADPDGSSLVVRCYE